MRPVGWGIVGCGRVAENRVAPAVQRASNSSLIAWCSRSKDRATAFAHRFDAPAGYDDLAGMLCDDRVEAVYVATPNALHAAQAIECLRAGRHVLVDKPMALTEADCKRMSEAAAECGRVLGVCHQQRFHPAHQECFRLIRAGKLGKLTILRAQMGFLFQPSDQWRLQPALSGGGPGMDLAPHAVDILLKAAGPAVRVAGRIASVRFDFPVEDFFLAQLDFVGGGVGIVETDYCSHAYGGRLEVRGDEGAFIAEGSLMAADRYRTWLLRGPSREPVETHEGEHHDCFRAAIEDFSDAVREQREPAVTASDGMAVQRVIDAVYATTTRTTGHHPVQ